MIKDVIVIVLFALSASIAAALVTPADLDLALLGLLIVDLLPAAGLGAALWKTLKFVLGLGLSRPLKIGAVLLCGLLLFEVAILVREMSQVWLGVGLAYRAALGLYARRVHGHELWTAPRSVQRSAPLSWHASFFRLAGVSLALDVLLTAWGVALALFVVRLLAVFLGTYGGGVLAGDPPERNRLSWGPT